MNGYVNIDYVVSSYILKSGEDDRFYEAYLQFVIQGLGELRLGSLTHIKATRLTLEGNNTATLPNDFVDYTAVGVCDGGRIRHLSENTNICLPTETECGVSQRDVTTTTNNENNHSQYVFVPHYYDGVYYEDYTAEGGFNTSYFRVDKAGRRLVFLNDANASGQQVILEYIANDINKDTVIPRSAVPVLEAYINYAKLEYKNVNFGEKRMAQRNYRNKLRKFRALNYSFTAQRWSDVISKNYTQGLKR